MITLQARNLKLGSIETAGIFNGEELRLAVAKASGLNPNRIRLTCPVVAAIDDPKAKPHVIGNEPLAPLHIKDELKVTAKDLGPQLGWRTVYLIEYLGPILIHLVLYKFPGLVYKNAGEPSSLQKWFFWANFAHYVKRELETLFVHRFSLGTMPARNVFKNSFHYWILGGLLPALCVYAPDSLAASKPLIFGRNYVGWDKYQQIALWGIWLFCEWGNLNSHLILRSLRPQGSTKRAIPYGFGFSVVSCPNYFFEAAGWFIQCLIVGNWSLWLFWIVGSGQMAIWAKQRHRRYRKEFKDYPPQRKAFIPRVW